MTGAERVDRVVLVRHGRTALNAEGRLRGLADPELDDRGVAEARAAARALVPLGIVRVVASPLRRAVRTAALIAEASGVPASADPAFNDRDYGPWTGHIRSEVEREWGSVDAAPGVEDTAVVFARAQTGIDALADEATGTVAVVTHDAVIRPLLAAMDAEVEAAATVETASWAVLERAGGIWRIVSVDNTARTVEP